MTAFPHIVSPVDRALVRAALAERDLRRARDACTEFRRRWAPGAEGCSVQSIRRPRTGDVETVHALERVPTMAEVWRLADRICRKHRLARFQLLSASRAAHIVAARFEAWAALHYELGLQKAEIAIIFEVDPTSVVHGIRKHEERAR